MIFPLLLMFPAVAVMVSLYVWPFAASIYRSFIDEGQFTLAHYQKASDLYMRDVVFTLVVAILVTLLSTIFSIGMATYLRLTNNRISKLLNYLYRIPIFIPFVLVAQMMRTFLAPHGLLNVSLAQVGLVDLDKPYQLFNMTGLVFSFVWKQGPFMTLIVLSGFVVIDDAFVEAARSVGANIFQVIIKILIPMNQTGIVMAIILVFTSTVGTFTLPFMLIAGSPNTITVDIAHRVTYFGDYGVANALGVISYIMVLITAIFYLRHSVQRGVDKST